MPSIINATTTAGVAVSGDNSGSLALQTNNGTTAVTIDTSQNVGIGTSSPAQKLNVATTSGNCYTRVDRANQSTGQVGYQWGGGTSSTDWLVYMPASSNDLAFFGNSAERMRINSSGDLYIGTTSGSGYGEKISLRYSGGVSTVGIVTQPTVNQYYNVGIFNNFAGSITGFIQINAAGNTCSFTSVSDYRLKENIASMTGALAKVQQLKPVTYTWKLNGTSGQGFIAHELQEVVPDCVTGEKDAVDEDGKPIYQGVDTSFLVATLTAAIQELNAKVEAQAAEIAELKAK